jgi:hypothetical protein
MMFMHARCLTKFPCFCVLVVQAASDLDFGMVQSNNQGKAGDEDHDQQAWRLVLLPRRVTR